MQTKESMKAAVFKPENTVAGKLLQIEEIARPQTQAGHVFLRVLACGVCRTDLHIVNGELPALRPDLIPSHQIVGEVVEGADFELPVGSRVGVSWLGGVDGDCPCCGRGLEKRSSALFDGALPFV